MAQNTPGKQLFDLLVTRGYDPEMLDSSGKAAPTAEDAEIYSFEFISSGGTNYGTVVVMLGDDKQLELFSGDNVGRGMDSEDKSEWYEFQHQLKNFATKNFMTFGSQNINRLKYSMQGQAALKEGLYESWNGTKNISWNGGPDSVRLMIRHKRPMGVNEARFRQVETLFVETAEGERYKLPFRNLAGGRAMVEHVRQGGRPYDMRGQHIANMVEELNVLSRFRRDSHGRVFEGDTANLVSETNVYHATMSRTLKGLASSRGYNSYFESWNPADITEQDVIIEDIKTLFVQETIDSRIEQALPILARIQQQGTAMKEANIFEAWAENLLEGTWATPNTPEHQQELIALLSQELPVGADATNATEQLYSLVGDDILFDQLQDLAEQDPDADCRNLVIARIKDMSNKGFEDFEPVLDALKSEQLAPATVAPEAPVAAAPAEVPPVPVAEQDEEYSVDGGMANELLQDDEEPGSCNYTAEGEHCPEHGLMECGSMYEGEQDTIARLRKLSGMNNSESDESMTEGSGYDGSEPLDLSKNPSVNDVFKRALYIYDYEVYSNDMDYSEDEAIEQYVAQKFGQDVLDQLTTAKNQQYFGRDDGKGPGGGGRTSNLGTSSAPGGNFRTTRAGVMNKQDAKMMKNRVADRLGRHPAPNLPESVAESEYSALSGQYGHSGKLQKFDAVEQDVLHRLRELSGMIRS